MSAPIFGDQYLTTEEKTFNIYERRFSYSGDSFDIKDSDGKFWQ